jgi:nucleoside-diphosphate kinase
MLNMRAKLFFNDLIEFITSGPVVAMIWEGEGVISNMRLLMGQTNPAQAAPELFEETWR